MLPFFDLCDSTTLEGRLLLCSEFRGGCARFGIFWRPVFGRKGYTPEVGAGRSELHADFRSPVAHRAEKCHMAFLFHSSLIVFHVDYAATNHAGFEQYQRAVRVDRESLCPFLEILALGILAANADADLHEHAL